MPKQYKASCKVHEDEELKSFPGEDLDRFRKRMLKNGHEVGDLNNADYMLTEKGHLIVAEIMKLNAKQEDLFKQLESEYKKIEIPKANAARPPFGGATDEKPNDTESSSPPST